MPESSDLSAEILGQINLMQSVVIQLPDKDTQLSFVCRGFKDIEGVDEVRYLKADKETKKEKGIYSFPISLEFGDNLTLEFKVSEPALFTPYTPYIRNFCKMLAVILNQKEQKRINGELMRDMNHQVQERTRALEEVMEDRIKTAEALQKSEERLELALFGADDGIWDLNLQNNKIHFDERYYTMAGYEPGEFEESLDMWKNLLHPDDRARSIEEMESYLEGKRPDFDIEFRFLHKNGNYLWIRSRGKIVKTDKQGIALRFVGTHSDITELKKTQAAFKNEKERLEIILRNIGEGVIATDLNGKIQEMNLTAEKLTQSTKKEALGLNIIELFPPLAPIEKNLFQYPVENKDTAVIKGSDGKEMTLSYSTSPIRDGSGTILGIILVIKDITEEIKLRESVQRSSKLDSLGLLAGGIAHDFNNLLGGIYGNLELASMEKKHQVQKEYLDKAGETIDRAKSLTRQLLTFARGGAPSKEVQALDSLIKKTVDFALSGSNVKCEVNIQADLYACNVDKEQMAQVLENLVINALQAMPEGGNIEVEALNIERKSGKWVQISIKDEGEGIPTGNLDRIFDPFFTTKPMGQGLGLSTCYSIIKRHNGTMEVQSLPGEGSTFTIQIPASEEKPRGQTSPLSENIEGSGQIFVLDDEELICNLLKSMLQSIGFSSKSFSRGEELLEYFENETTEAPTAMIFDLTIPGGLGGKATLKKLRGMGIDCPVFVSSGYATDSILAHPQSFGFAGSMSKPFRKKELISLLQPFMKKKIEEEDRAEG